MRGDDSFAGRRIFLAVHTPADGDAAPAALNNAQLGDTIILQAGTTYKTTITGGHGAGFTLPNKTTGSGWITIQSSERSRQLPAKACASRQPTRPTCPAAPRAAANVVGHQHGDVGAPLQVRRHRVRRPGEQRATSTALISLGTDTTAQNTVASVPHHLIIDRCYMRPNTPTRSIRRAIALNSDYTDIINSYIEEIHQPGSDSQAIGGWNGTGHVQHHQQPPGRRGREHHVRRRDGPHPGRRAARHRHPRQPHHQAAALAGLDPTGYSTTSRTCSSSRTAATCSSRATSWRTAGSTGRPASAIVLKLGNLQSTPWNVTEDIVFRNNIMRHANGAIALQGRDYAGELPGGLVRRLTFTTTSSTTSTASGPRTPGPADGGNILYMTHGPKDVTFDHNTFINGCTADR